MSDADKVKLAAVVTEGNASERFIAEINAAVQPMAGVLLHLPARHQFSVMGSLLSSWALAQRDPVGAVNTLVAEVLKRLPEGAAQMRQKRH